ncbi:MAG: response regulator [Proteobacteria bacterium]|nr:response regulator [Pseudomonadota bacterium]
MTTNRYNAVLVIDDNRDLAENVKEIIEGENVVADVAYDGRSALNLIEKSQYGLIITDIRMPGMDGVEVVKTIHQRWPNLPVVVMTAFSSDETLSAAVSAGALDVLTKPLDVDRMLGLVQRITEPNAPVLVVEDDPDLLGNLSEALLDIAGVIPHMASDVATAERLIAEIQFRVAIIDARLPDGCGLDFGSRLQKRCGDQTALIYITGFADDLGSELSAIVDSEQIHLLIKPFSPRALLDLVRENIELPCR